MKLISKCIFVLIFATMSLPSVSLSMVHTASSCNSSDVQAKLNIAAAGDTVSIPAGVCTWTEGVSIGTVGSDAITLQGQGENLTIINMGFSDVAISVPSGTSHFRITGIKFNVNQRSWTWGVINVGSSGDRLSFRIDHITIDNAAGVRGFVVGPGTSRCQPYRLYGLIDHVTVNKSATGGLQGVTVFGYCRDINYTTGLEAGPNAWTEDDMAGTDKAVYVEDSTFNYGGFGISDGVYDVYDSGRIVFRHNTVIGTGPGVHGFDSSLGARWQEIYENRFYGSIRGWNWRGGGGVVFNNIADSEAGPNFQVYRATASYGNKGQAPTAKIDGYPVGGTNYDTYGYPARYQPATGKNNIPSPIYLWNNTNYTPEVMIGAENFIKLNRDFYVGTPRPGYTPYTYPHPLSTAIVPPPPITVPAAPSNLHVK